MSNLTHLAPDYIRAIAPYQGGKPIAELAREMGGSAVRFDDWQGVLERVDVVISSSWARNGTLSALNTGRTQTTVRGAMLQCK